MRKICYVAVLFLSFGSDPQFPAVDKGVVQYGTPFKKIHSTQDIVMYEVNTRAFSTAGNFQGVIDRLDKIKALGINTIWLMPIYPVGQLKSAGGLGSPYSVQNYHEVNPEFGDLAKLRELVQKAHEMDMAVILDWVANHTSWDNPWITQHKDWYTQDGAGNIIIPPTTNWQDVAELNYDNKEMRAAMIGEMKYWVITANVDGFRCDAADYVPTDFWREAITDLNNLKDRKLIFLAEGSKTDQFTAGFQMNYAWDFYNNLKEVYKNGKKASSIFTTHVAEYNGIPSGGKKLRYTTNHDLSAYDGTPVELFGGINGALSASVATIFTSAVPLVYSSQEVGQSSLLPFFEKDPIDWSANQDMEKQYEKLFDIYNSTQVFTSGSFVYYSNDDVACFKRVKNKNEYLIIDNVRNVDKEFNLDPAVANGTWINAVDGKQVTLGSTISLKPYQYLILSNK